MNLLPKSTRLTCIATLVLWINGAGLQAAVITVGLGNIAASSLDTGSGFVAVDENNPQFLAPGTYNAVLFNHQFVEAGGATVIPALEISNGSGRVHNDRPGQHTNR